MSSSDDEMALSPEEKRALRETLRERRSLLTKDSEAARKLVEETLAALPEPDRSLAEQIHLLILQVAPALRPRLWYGMPAYATPKGKVICFFQPASKFKTRYATIGFTDTAALDEGSLWPTSFAITALGEEEKLFLTELLRRATRDLP